MSEVEIDSCTAHKKLYLVYCDDLHRAQNKSYAIYCLDLSEASSDFKEPISMPNPILTLEESIYPSQMGFGVHKSTIFMLGGFKSVTASDHQCRRESSLGVWIFDPAASVLTDGPPLNHPKIDPICISVGEKLYALPGSLGPPSVMEVLNPYTNQWEDIELPYQIWEMGQSQYLEENHNNPFDIISYGVRGSQIILSLRMSSLLNTGIFVYETLNSEWHLRKQVVEHMSDLPFLGGCIFWDKLWCATHSWGGCVWLHDVGLGDNDDDSGKLRLIVPKPPLYPTTPVVREEDGRVIEVAPKLVLVVSRLLIKVKEPGKPKRGRFELRLDFLRLSLRSESGSEIIEEHVEAEHVEEEEWIGPKTDERLVCERVKSMSFVRDAISDRRGSVGVIDNMEGMGDYCFLI